jgi:pentatricopeptide repeat protein
LCHNSLGILYVRLGQNGKGIAEFRESVSLDPRFKGAWSNLALACQLQGDLDGACRCYEQLVAMDSSDADSVAHLADALCRMGRLEESAAVCRRLLETGCSRPQVFTQLGTILARQGRSAEAEQMFRRARETDESNKTRPSASALRASRQPS